MDSFSDKINTVIPKQVRDDNERDFQKAMAGMIAFVIPKTPHSVMLNSLQHLGLESRWKLRNDNPLDAGKRRLSVNGPPSSERIKTGSRNKFGMTMRGTSKK